VAVFYGLGIADLLFCFLLLYILIIPRSLQAMLLESRALRLPISATVYIGVFAMVSLIFNTFIYDAEIKDVFEILRYLYLAAVMVATSYYTRTMGIVPVVDLLSELS